MRMLLAMLLVSCAGDNPHADVSWLIDQQHERVMGIIAKHQSKAKLYVLLECSTYDSLSAASKAYAAGRTNLPNDCHKLIEQELTPRDLPAPAKENQLLQKISSGAGIATLILGLSERHANFLVDAASHLKEADVLPKLLKGNYAKKAGILVLAGILLTKSITLWKQDGNEVRTAIAAEIKGVKYRNSMQDIELTAAEYRQARQMLIEALGLPPTIKMKGHRPIAN